MAFDIVEKGLFRQYYKHVGEECVAVPVAAVPAETKLLTQEFKRAKMGKPYTSPSDGVWAEPGPKLGPFTTLRPGGGLRPHRHQTGIEELTEWQ